MKDLDWLGLDMTKETPMIRHYTQQELFALTIGELNALETQLRLLLDDLDPNSTDADIVRTALTAIASIRRLKRRRVPTP